MGILLVEYVIQQLWRRVKLRGICFGVVVGVGVSLMGLMIFSRVFLGMHTINQTLFSVVLGIYFVIVYYLYL
jgi:membrane-associated phospholipid phosphatase